MTKTHELRPFRPQEVRAKKGIRDYWVGFTEDCPVSQRSIGPITVHKESFSIVRDKAGNPVEDNDGLTKRKFHDGKIEPMTRAQAMEVCAKAMRMAVRVHPLPDMLAASGDVLTGRTRTVVYKVDQPAYTPMSNDVLLSDYLYILDFRDSGKYGGAHRHPTITTDGEITLPAILEEGASKTSAPVAPTPDSPNPAQDVESLKAQYAALPNKRGADGHRLRAAIKEAEERAAVGA